MKQDATQSRRRVHAHGIFRLVIFLAGRYLTACQTTDTETITIAPDGRKAVYCDYDFHGPASCLKRLAVECPHGYEVLRESMADKFAVCLRVGGENKAR